MRIAVLSDIHGNSIALNAVLSDIKAQGGVDLYLILGDLVALGFDPVGALTSLARLSPARFSRGNTDDYLVSEDAIEGLLDKARDGEGVERIVPILRSLAWTQGALSQAGWLEWIADLPLEQRLVLPDGTRLLGVHAAPGQIDGSGIHPGLTTDQQRQLIRGCDADLVCVGHTHWPLDIHVDGIHVVNLGSVSNPKPPDLRASYILIDADVTGYCIRHCRVDYDHEAVIHAIDRVRLPAAPYMRGYMLGHHRAEWLTYLNNE